MVSSSPQQFVCILQQKKTPKKMSAAAVASNHAAALKGMESQKRGQRAPTAGETAAAKPGNSQHQRTASNARPAALPQQQRRQQYVQSPIDPRKHHDDDDDDDEDEDEDEEDYDDEVDEDEDDAPQNGRRFVADSMGANAARGKQQQQQQAPRQAQQKIANHLDGRHHHHHQQQHEQKSNGEIDRAVAQAASELLGVRDEVGSLFSRTIKFDFAFTIDDLLNGNQEKFVSELPGDERLFQMPVYDASAPNKARHAGDPRRSMIKFIKVVDKYNSSPIRFTYGSNLISTDSVAEHGSTRAQRIYSSGKTALDDILPFEQNPCKDRLGTLWANNRNIDPVIFQVYSSLTEEDLTRGIMPVGRGGKFVSIQLPRPDEERGASDVNTIIPWTIFRNKNTYHQQFNMAYDLLLEDARTKHMIIIPTEAYEFAKRMINVNGIEKGRQNVKDLTRASLVLGAPDGGEPGDFSGLRKYLEKHFGDRLEAMRDTTYNLSIDLKIAYAMPGV